MAALDVAKPSIDLPEPAEPAPAASQTPEREPEPADRPDAVSSSQQDDHAAVLTPGADSETDDEDTAGQLHVAEPGTTMALTCFSHAIMDSCITVP